MSLFTFSMFAALPVMIHNFIPSEWKFKNFHITKFSYHFFKKIPISDRTVRNTLYKYVHVLLELQGLSKSFERFKFGIF